MQMGSRLPFCKSQKEGREEDKTQQELKASPQPNYKGHKQDNPEP